MALFGLRWSFLAHFWSKDVFQRVLAEKHHFLGGKYKFFEKMRGFAQFSWIFAKNQTSLSLKRKYLTFLMDPRFFDLET